MASEATIRTSLAIRVGNIDYKSETAGFTANVNTAKGPCPGAFTATVAGTDIDLSQLSTPGLYKIKNLDLTNFVELGIWDDGTSTFFPIHEILPGEYYVGRFSRNLFESYAGVGTGTGPAVNSVRIKANTASCNVVVEAFEA